MCVEGVHCAHMHVSVYVLCTLDNCIYICVHVWCVQGSIVVHILLHWTTIIPNQPQWLLWPASFFTRAAKGMERCVWWCLYFFTCIYGDRRPNLHRHMNPLWLVDCLAPRTKWPSCGNYITNANVTGRSYILMFHQCKYAVFIDWQTSYHWIIQTS